jgi:hypothetical protein
MDRDGNSLEKIKESNTWVPNAIRSPGPQRYPDAPNTEANKRWKEIPNSKVNYFSNTLLGP